MLLNTSLVATVGSGMSSTSSRRMLYLYNCRPSSQASTSATRSAGGSCDGCNSLIACLVQPYAICGVKLTPERLVVLNEKYISIFVLQSLVLLRTLERHPNLPQQPRGGFLFGAGTAAVAAAASAAVAASAAAAASATADSVSQEAWLSAPADDGRAHAAAAAADATQAVLAVGWSPQHSYLALPAGPHHEGSGILCLFDLMRGRFCSWRCTHEDPLRAIVFSASASLVAAISAKGSVVRIFTVPSLEYTIALQLHNPQMLLQSTPAPSMAPADPEQGALKASEHAVADAASVLKHAAGAETHVEDVVLQQQGKEGQLQQGCARQKTAGSRDGTIGKARDSCSAATAATAAAASSPAPETVAFPADSGPPAAEGVDVSLEKRREDSLLPADSAEASSSSSDDRRGRRGRAHRKKQKQMLQRQQQKQHDQERDDQEPLSLRIDKTPARLPKAGEVSPPAKGRSHNSPADRCTATSAESAVCSDSKGSFSGCSSDKNSADEEQLEKASFSSKDAGTEASSKVAAGRAAKAVARSGSADRGSTSSLPTSNSRLLSRKNRKQTVQEASQQEQQIKPQRQRKSSPQKRHAQTLPAAYVTCALTPHQPSNESAFGNGEHERQQQSGKEESQQGRSEALQTKEIPSLTDQESAEKPVAANGAESVKFAEVSFSSASMPRRKKQQKSSGKSPALRVDAVNFAGVALAQSASARRSRSTCTTTAAAAAAAPQAKFLSAATAAASAALQNPQYPQEATFVGSLFSRQEEKAAQGGLASRSTSPAAADAAPAGRGGRRKASLVGNKEIVDEGWVLCGSTPRLDGDFGGSKFTELQEEPRGGSEEERLSSCDSANLSAEWSCVEASGGLSPSGYSSPPSRNSSGHVGVRAGRDTSHALFLPDQPLPSPASAAGCAEKSHLLGARAEERHTTQVLGGGSLTGACCGGFLRDSRDTPTEEAAQQRLLPAPAWLAGSHHGGTSGSAARADTDHRKHLQKEAQHCDTDATDGQRGTQRIILTGEPAAGFSTGTTDALRQVSLAFSGCSRIFTASRGDGLVFVFHLPWTPGDLQRHSKCGVAVQQQLLRSLQQGGARDRTATDGSIALSDTPSRAVAQTAACASASAGKTPLARPGGSSKLSSITGVAASALASVTSLLLPASLSERLIHGQSCASCIALPSTAAGRVSCVASSDLLAGDKVEVVVGLNNGFAYTYSCQLNASGRYRLRDEQILETQGGES
ncbi:uncharacterized protein LOC34624329 [Cyclospora cayetanensis]|uniref:Uncharacterized protein LOC34624329 n=1 Tax=Cyclospora cayetanensis TaxID=88456 RepID=A0A6P6RTX2_9EIME|nr:uncharacterized protein LOC34624329 [Cyclospora cayetanensis]